MASHEDNLRRVTEFAQSKNPVWPMAAVILDREQRVLVRAANAWHLSPTYHPEVVALNVLAREYPAIKRDDDLVMYSSVEPCAMCVSAVHWAIVTGRPVRTIIYGAAATVLKTIWGFDAGIPSQEMSNRLGGELITIVGPELEDECAKALAEAKALHAIIDKSNPGRATLSQDVDHFYDTPAKSGSRD
ncbi:MAG TPA: deaminase [Elusimicrobiota bacterium]|nr:deaminase [Elusimicrobiota bacterium]